MEVFQESIRFVYKQYRISISSASIPPLSLQIRTAMIIEKSLIFVVSWAAELQFIKTVDFIENSLFYIM